jgi:capsular polysaccharide transport system ATP-binding protein
MSVTLPTDRRLAIFGLPGSGKSTLISLLAGSEKPNSGTISRYARLSYPVGSAKGLKMSLSMRHNAKYVARIYGCNATEVMNFVEKLLGYEPIFDKPMKRLPAREKVAFHYALSYAIPFDTYLVDGSLAGPPGALRVKLLALCEARAETAGIIFATSHVRSARQICDMGAVISDKTLVLYDDLEEAIQVFEEAHDRHAMEEELVGIDGVYDDSQDSDRD